MERFIKNMLTNANGLDNLLNDYRTSGNHSIIWNGDHFNSGIYFVKMNSGKKQDVRKIMLIK